MRWWRSSFIFLMFVGLIAGSIYLYHPNLFAWYLKGYCEKCYHCHIDYKEVKRSPQGALLLTGVTIKPTRGAVRGIEATCDIVSFDYRMDWGARKLTGELHLDHPVIKLGTPPSVSPSPEISWLPKLKRKRRAFFFISPSLDVKATEGAVADELGANLGSWTAEASIGKQIQAQVKLATPDGGEVVVELHEESKELAMHLAFEQFPLSTLISFVKSLDKGWKSWSSARGALDGDLDLVLGRHPPILHAAHMALVGYQVDSPLGMMEGEQVFFRSQAREEGDHRLLRIRGGRWEKRGWTIDNVVGEVIVEQGCLVQGSSLHGKLGELVSTIALEGSEKSPLLHLALEGTFDQLPDVVRRDWELPASWEQEKLELTIYNTLDDVWKVAVKSGQDTLEGEGRLRWQWFGKRGPAVRVEEGHFATSSLKMARYAPWLETFHRPLFSQQKWEGSVKLDGEWTGSKLVLQPHFDRLQAEWDGYTVMVPSIDCGVVTYDKKRQKLEGELPLRHLQMTNRERELAFSEGRGLLLFDQEKIEVQNLELFGEGLFTITDLHIDLQDGQAFEVALNNHTLGGSFSELKALAKRYDPALFFLEVPIEGNISYLGEGLTARWRYNAKDTQPWELLEAKVEGELTEGTTHTHYGRMALHGLSLRVDYNHHANQLVIQDIQGSLLVGKGENLETYDVAGDKIHFTDFAHNGCSFDLWVGLRNRDILRIVGKTEEGEDKVIHFYFDHDLTHLGVIHPSASKLVVEDWNRLQELDLRFTFPLQTAFGDIQRFIRSGFLGMSPGVTKAVSDIKQAHGTLDLHLHWDSLQQFDYHLRGYDVHVGEAQFDVVRLEGKRKEQMWLVDELQLDQFLFSAEVLNEGKNLRIPFFGLQVGETAMVGSDALYYSEDDHLEANLNLLEIDLSHLEEFAPLQPFAQRYQPQGKLRGRGSLRIEFLKDHWYRAEALIHAQLKDVNIQGVPFSDVDEVAMGYISDRGITFQALETSMPRSGQDDDEITLQIDKGGYDFLAEELWLRGVQFHVPNEHLPWIAKTLQKALPDAFPPYLAHFLAKCKQKDALQGALDVQARENMSTATLNLDEGVYSIGGHRHHLKHTTFTFTPNDIKLNTLYQMYGRWLLFSFQTPSFDFPYGSLIISTQFQQEPPLVIAWNREPGGGFWIQHAEGSLAGASIALKGSSHDAYQDHWNLKGNIEVDWTVSSKFFPQMEWAAFADHWRLGKGYKLQGTWHVPKTDPQRLAFQGCLSGERCELMGYVLEGLQADLSLDFDHIRFTNTQVKDHAGRLDAQQIDLLRKEDGAWKLETPKLVLSSFRPKHLQRIGRKPKKRKETFAFSHVELSDVKGDLADPYSLVALGSFSFVNPRKSKNEGAFFSIPSDMLQKVGLDLAALTPVSGEVAFEVDHGTILIIGLHDVYSENKLVKFQLPKHTRSSVGFNGQLDLHLALKPYHVMFKFAEFFTLGVQGDVRQPTFTIEK